IRFRLRRLQRPGPDVMLAGARHRPAKPPHPDRGLRSGRGGDLRRPVHQRRPRRTRDAGDVRRRQLLARVAASARMISQAAPVPEGAVRQLHPDDVTMGTPAPSAAASAGAPPSAGCNAGLKPSPSGPPGLAPALYAPTSTVPARMTPLKSSATAWSGLPAAMR